MALDRSRLRCLTGVPTVLAVGAGDPVASGLVVSLARPGGNVTGISDNATTLSTKRLELLKQAVPSIHKVAMLWNKDDLGMTLRFQASAAAAKSFERAASLVDRIFKGAKPADLPFEEPTKYLFVVNLKTAKSIGLELSPNLLALADEVIE